MDTLESPKQKTGKYPVVGEPVDSKKRKKKRGSSRSARRLEDIEDRASKSLHRVAKAVENGVSTYIDKRDSSARKRRDGALVDFYENAAGGISKTISSPCYSESRHSPFGNSVLALEL